MITPIQNMVLNNMNEWTEETSNGIKYTAYLKRYNLQKGGRSTCYTYTTKHITTLTLHYI